jgi:uncharacterized protein YhbP (UPF0306 family)
VTVEQRARRFASRRLEQVARRLMASAPLCALATVTPGGRAYINHMYFAWNDRFEVFWYSDEDSVHSRNLARNPSAAITIYDSHQVNGRPDRGIQLFGTAAIAKGDEATRIYKRRFRAVDPSAYAGYRFRPRTVKLFDERSLAPAMLVTARVTRDGLTWLKTEVWVTA